LLILIGDALREADADAGFTRCCALMAHPSMHAEQGI
jgi:hypothetical protein